MTGLGIRGQTRRLPEHGIYLSPADAGRAAHATALHPAQLQAMTLARYHPHVVRIDHDRQAVTRSAPWTRRRGSRFCPACLSERDGRWCLRWRLSWVFACTEHEMLLHDTCPACATVPRQFLLTREGPHPPAICTHAPIRGGDLCRADLRAAPARPLPPGDQLLAAQQWIDTLLTTIEIAPAPEPTTTTTPGEIFADLQTVGGWLLRHSRDEDYAAFPEATQTAWRELRTAKNTGSHVLGSVAPSRAALIGATIVRAIPLVSGHDHDAIGQLREILHRIPGPRTLRPPGISARRWAVTSPHVQGRFLQAIDDQLAHTDRLRALTGTPWARVPDATLETLTRRAANLPRLLWPEWAVLLQPATGFAPDTFRSVMCACLLLPGQRTPPQRDTIANLHPYLASRELKARLNHLVDRGHEAVLAAIAHLAEYLDTHHSPIDYQRRRTVITPDVLNTQEWTDLCYRTSAHPGHGRRHLDARRHLHQLLTGDDLGDPTQPLAWHNPADRVTCLTFIASLTSPLRQALTEHGAAHLARLGIDEPLTWHPPLDIVDHLHLPGRHPDDIDLDAVRRLALTQALPLSVVADRLATTIDHVRLALERISRGPRVWGANAAPASRQLRQRARNLLTRDFFDREYLHAGKSLEQLATETGIHYKLLAEHAHDAKIIIRAGPAPTPIDAQWLREHLHRGRTFLDLAAHLGVHEATVSRAAQRHGIKRPHTPAATPTQLTQDPGPARPNRRLGHAAETNPGTDH
jgi:AraC-like DNA-binding protein